MALDYARAREVWTRRDSRTNGDNHFLVPTSEVLQATAFELGRQSVPFGRSKLAGPRNPYTVDYEVQRCSQSPCAFSPPWADDTRLNSFFRAVLEIA
jgi:hypothetical protein